jgi:hypothetical protein
LDQLPSVIADDYIAEHWQEILDVLNAGEMPPEDEPQPKTEELASVIAAMTDVLHDARKRLVDPKSVTLRRLNKREYGNTIQDLLGVPVDTSELPADGTLDGFDTIGDAHFMSTAQFEGYLTLAKLALDSALVDGPRPKKLAKRLEPEESVNERIMKSLSDSAKKKKKAGQKAKEALAAGYLNQPGAKIGHILDYPGVPLPNPKHDRVTLVRPGAFGVKRARNPLIQPGKPLGKYVARFRAGLTCQPTNGERLLVEVVRLDTFSHDQSYNYLLGVFEITKTMDDPHVFEVPFENFGEVDDKIVVQVLELNESQYAPVARQRGKAVAITDTSKVPYVWVDWVEAEGPFIDQWPPPAWTNTFFNGAEPAKAEESDYAKAIIERFSKRAFRGKDPNPEFIAKVHAIYADYRGSGSSFIESVKEALAVVLASPSFVYLVEPNVDDEKRRLTDLELASRLSYFLWSHPPDEELLRLAQDNKLGNAEILRNQVDRLLNDPKANHFTHAFISLWLGLDWLDTIAISEKFKNFDLTVRKSMRDEPVEMFRELIRTDGSLTNFIDSEFTMANGILSRFYGLENVQHEKGGFKKVALPAHSPRGGLLGMGSVLTMTGTGQRTSPVERGVFVYEHMLGKDIPPPPPNVPQLVVEDGNKLTVRQLLDSHTSKAQCASCHRRMDPYGFALENFDAVGTWRDHEEREGTDSRNRKTINKLPIDSSWTAPGSDQEKNGHKMLKTYLMENSDLMAGGFLRSILTYALGRRVGFSDSLSVERLQAQWKESDYGMRSLIHTIVQGDEFRSK